MKYRLLKEAALRELMEEDFRFSGFSEMPDDILDRVQKRDEEEDKWRRFYKEREEREKQEQIRREEAEKRYEEARKQEEERHKQTEGNVYDVWFTDSDEHTQHIVVKADDTDDVVQKVQAKYGDVTFNSVEERMLRRRRAYEDRMHEAERRQRWLAQHGDALDKIEKMQRLFQDWNMH